MPSNKFNDQESFLDMKPFNLVIGRNVRPKKSAIES
jgi:hypothetical protein